MKTIFSHLFFVTFFSIILLNKTFSAQPGYYPNLLDKNGDILYGPLRDYTIINTGLFCTLTFEKKDDNCIRCFDLIPRGQANLLANEKRPSELFGVINLSIYGLLSESHKELYCRLRTAKIELAKINNVISSNTKEQLHYDNLCKIFAGLCLASMPFLPLYVSFIPGALSYLSLKENQTTKNLYHYRKKVINCIHYLEKAAKSPTLHIFLKTKAVLSRDVYYNMEELLKDNVNLNNTINAYLGLPIRLTNEPHAGEVYEHLDFSSCGFALNFFLTPSEVESYQKNNGWIPLSNHTYMFDGCES